MKSLIILGLEIPGVMAIHSRAGAKNIATFFRPYFNWYLQLLNRILTSLHDDMVLSHKMRYIS